jgi:hypothetical protein
MRRRILPGLLAAAVVFLVAGLPGVATTQIDNVPGRAPGALETILTLAGLPQGLPGSDLVLPMVQGLVADTAFVRLVLRELDLNGDGTLTLDEVVTADVLDAARRVERRYFTRREQATSAVVGNDDTLRAVASAYAKGVAADVALEPNEAPPPGLPLAALKGDATALVGSLPRAALLAVTDRVADLDTRAVPAGDMAHPDMQVNAGRKAVLMNDAQRMIGLFEADRWGSLRDELGRLRARADGRRSDWVAGPKARGLVAKIDLLLQLLPRR